MTTKKKNKTVRFWIKLIPALFPMISTLVFLIAQGIYLFDNPMQYWTDTIKNTAEVTRSITYYTNFNTGQKIGYLLCRNLLMFTTLGNILNAAFFINSAVNNKHEGIGKFDNYKCGLMCVNTITFVILFYNLSLIFANDFGHMKWYNWMSWFCEHSFPQLVMIIYFFVFYPKIDVVHSYEQRNNNKWTVDGLLSIAPVFVYMIFFTALGFILKAAKTTPVFGEMSATGYFPYSFLDFSQSNTMVVKLNYIAWLRPWSEFIAVMIALFIEQILSYSIMYKICTKQASNNKIKLLKTNDLIGKETRIFEYEKM